MFDNLKNLPVWILIGAICFTSCGDDDSDDVPSGIDCEETTSLLFEEDSSFVLVEFEDAEFENEWSLISDLSNSTGRGFMLWEGDNFFGNPGNGLATYQIKINTPGTYRFIWRSAVKEGDNGTEANDSWLRFADADDFYGERSNGSIVYPRGTGKTPNPEGASSDGWFKVYRSGSDLDFKWQARTSDNDAHLIFVQFDNAGTYTMEVSARSRGHAIDKFLLFRPEIYTENEATELTVFSEITCE
ncbi:MAG: hypothetical protein AAGG59_19415 [Bacteroidota bacterium]